MVAALSFAMPMLDDARAQELAKDLFGSKRLPAVSSAPKSYGFYSKGCFSGGVAIPTDGAHWQAMRLSRNRRWGHPTMIALLEKFADDAAKDGWPGLMLGDISQPRGGPMLTGHASHQLGLDADIWFTPMPQERLSVAARETARQTSMIRKGGLTVDDRVWSDAHMRLLKRAASYPQVERILVHPGIKKKLCDTVTGDRSWLRKVRPFWGHDEHFHIRIGCQPGSTACKPQAAPPAGDGCDKSLAWWFTEEPWRPNKDPDAPKARDVMKMKSLPKECAAVLAMPSPPSEMAVTLGQGTSLATVTAPPLQPDPPETAAMGDAEMAPNAFAPTPKMSIPLPRQRPGN
ncbi:MAG: penicillin-insensitive murein endopeptidase [Rhizobiaceae bacterium]|nr:penicillin-insensitive murein endopeptidase [Rhizobiaceae bacterium]